MIQWLKNLFKNEKFVIAYKPWWSGFYQKPFYCGPFRSRKQAESYAKKRFSSWYVSRLEPPKG
jgi:hypothetical protein